MKKYIQSSALGVMMGVMAAAMPLLAHAADYQVDPTAAANISTMTSTSTASFLSVFTTNWPTIVTFAITILAFFWIWGLLQRFFRGRRGR